MQNMTRPAYINVTCGLIETERCVLVTKRGPGTSQAGLWEFPGGKLEAGETEEEGLCREIWEELRLRVIPYHRLTTVEHHYVDKHIRLLPWVCRSQAGVIQLQEHTDAAWASIEELPQFDWSPADIPVYKAYIEYRKQCNV